MTSPYRPLQNTPVGADTDDMMNNGRPLNVINIRNGEMLILTGTGIRNLPVPQISNYDPVLSKVERIQSELAMLQIPPQRESN